MTTAGTTTDEAVVTRHGPVLTLLLNRPRSHNALTWAMYDTIERACATAAADRTVRALVLRGAGGRAFASGTDIAQFATFSGGADGVRYEARVERILRGILGLDVPTVAVIEGYAVGAGLMLTAACDVRLCTPGAKFGAPVARTLGNALSQFGYDLLADRLGAGPTLQALVTADLLDDAAVAALGFVHRVVPAAELDRTLTELTDRLTGSAPLTLRAFKRADRARRDDQRGESDFVHECYGSADFAAGVSAFVHGAAPTWTGR